MINWNVNAKFFGITFLTLLTWISGWSLIELTTERYITKYWIKMIFYGLIFLTITLIILTSADKFLI